MRKIKIKKEKKKGKKIEKRNFLIFKKEIKRESETEIKRDRKKEKKKKKVFFKYIYIRLRHHFYI